MNTIKLLRLLIEAEEEKKASGEEQEVKDLLKQDYETFVNQLKVDVQDKKFLDAIRSLANKNKIEWKNINVPVSQLIPTQNEIDIDKSLAYPLTKPESAKQCLAGGVVEVAKKRIVTAGGGKYIIDGHHRWSQLCAMNPEAEIAAVDLIDIEDPFKALKATQLGIAADLGKIDTQDVKGQNLLKIQKEDLKKYVVRTMNKPVAYVFRDSGVISGDLVKKSVDNKKDQEEKPEENPVNERADGQFRELSKKASDYIWRNVERMQKNNQPVTGAPGRGLMPQTDDATKWKENAPDTEEISEINDLMKRAGIKK
jgi:hypothetical protein